KLIMGAAIKLVGPAGVPDDTHDFTNDFPDFTGERWDRSIEQRHAGYEPLAECVGYLQGGPREADVESLIRVHKPLVSIGLLREARFAKARDQELGRCGLGQCHCREPWFGSRKVFVENCIDKIVVEGKGERLLA